MTALLAIVVVNKGVRNAPKARQFGQLASAVLPNRLATQSTLYREAVTYFSPGLVAAIATTLGKYHPKKIQP